MKSSLVNINELDDILKIVELQRDLSVRLHLLKKKIEGVKKEQEEITAIAQRLAILTRSSKKKKEWISLNDEEKKEINKLLSKRHIKL